MNQPVDFLDTLSTYRPLVWQVIKPYLDDLVNFPNFCKPAPKYQSLVNFNQNIISDYPTRQGKYVRPTLVLLTASSMGFPVSKALLTAAAMQVSEDWILIHDDFEDDSEQRRGQPALHHQIGKELAVNAGDGLHILMWKILSDNQNIIGSTLSYQIQQEFYTMLSRTVLGQTTEIKWTQENNLDLTEKDVLFILESKTAYYTIAGPMRLGAILAGTTPNQLDKIFQFGKYLGFCFQIQDDLLDLTSDFAGHKKQTGNDIYEGKRTIMLVHLLKNIEPKNKQKLIKILSKPRFQKTPKEVTWVIDQMDKYGSLDYSRKQTKKYADLALDYFQTELKFLSKNPARQQLLSFIDFLQNRQY